MSFKEEIDKSEIVTEQEREFAQVALTEFKQKNYSACLQNIAKLDGKSQDFKVLHNKYVAEYYKSDLKKIEQFQKSLNGLFLQFNLHQDKLDDLDHCIAFFNLAILYYHQKQYTAALKLMDRVYKFIEPMDEEVGRKVGLLLVELHLCVKQVDKATNLITYLHNHALNQTTPTTMNTTKVPVKQKQEKEKKPAKPISKETGAFLKVLDKYRVRCNLLNRTLKITRADLQLLSKENKDKVDVLFMLANQQYLEGNFQDAMKTLTSIPSECLKIRECGESSNVMFYNNMGVIHHAMGKPNLSCYYYQQALKEDLEMTKRNSDSQLHTLGASRYHELMYNLGISLLFAGKPTQAFECLIIAVKRYHRNSRLWLRLAECCIHVHKPSNLVDFDIPKRLKDMVVEVIGSKDMQKIILTTNIADDKKYSSESQTYAMPVATLEFASLCLRNALTLIPSDTTSSPVPLLLMPGTTAQSATSNLGPSPSSSLNVDGINELTNAIYVASAYVSICIGDYVMGLEHATKLLEQTKVSGAHKILGHLYSAECLVLLDKLTEAAEHLNPDKIRDISIEIPESNVDEIKVKTKPPSTWFPNNLLSTIAVMQYNMAVVKTLRGNYDQASVLLKQIWQSKTTDEFKVPVPVHIIMLVLYIELQLGHIDVARTLIKQYSFQQRFGG